MGRGPGEPLSSSSSFCNDASEKSNSVPPSELKDIQTNSCTNKLLELQKCKESSLAALHKLN